MEYFYISQDKRYRNAPEINHFYDRYYPNLFNPTESYRIPEKNVVYCQSEKNVDMVDIISGPVFFVSEEVKKVFSAYDDTICFKLFFLLNTVADQGQLYYVPILPEFDCLKLDKKMRGPQLYLDSRKMEGRYICRVQGKEYNGGLVVNKEVAESLLRRRLKGISYRRLEVIACQNI